MRRFVVVGVVAGCVALGGVPPAIAFQGPWLAPVDLSATGRDAFNPSLAVAPDGTTAATWTRSDGANTIAQASTRPPGGAFANPVDLSVPGQNAVDAHVVVAPDDTTTAIWYRFNGTNAIVQASTRPPGGAFAAPVDLSATGRDAFVPRVAVAPDGTTIATWQRSNGTNIIVQASTRPPGGTFGAPVDLSATGRDALNPQPVVAPDGTTTVTWERSNGTNSIVQASTRPPGGAFGAPVDLSATGRDALNPQLAVAPDGTTAATWERSNGTNYIVQASIRPPGGAFTNPVDLSATGQSALNPQVGLAPDGTTTVIWKRSNGTNIVVQASTRPPGGAFAGPVDLSATGRNATDEQLAVAPDGTTTATWQRFDGANTIVQASTRPPGGAFAGPVDLSAAGQSAIAPQLVAGQDGATTVAWQRSNGTNAIAQAAYTANPPALRAPPQITGAAALGAALSCDGGSWTGAALTTTDWLRGAGQIATGAGYTTSAADQGSALACRARASNPFGSVEALSTPLSIPSAPGPTPQPAPPSPRSLPKITGAARLGRFLRCRPAAFTGATGLATSWLRGSRPIRGAHRTRYRITRKDLGRIIACRTRATGPGGTSTTISLGVLARR